MFTLTAFHLTSNKLFFLHQSAWLNFIFHFAVSVLKLQLPAILKLGFIDASAFTACLWFVLAMKHYRPNMNMIRGSWAGAAAHTVAGAGWKVWDYFNYLPGNSKSKTGSCIFRGRYIASTKQMNIYISYLQKQHQSVQVKSSEG